MPSDKDDSEKGFTVKDRRMFTEAGDEKEKNDTAAADSTASATIIGDTEPEMKPEPDLKADTSTESRQRYPLPEINFATFVFSLNSSAYVQLGLIEDPANGRKTKNLPLAKQTIDILGMLQEKTAGNLTPDEEAMLKNILYDLRIAYVREKS